MRKNNSTPTPQTRQQREPGFDEPLRRWSTFPVTQKRASELVDAFTRYDDGDMIDALIQLIHGLAPAPAPDELRRFRRAAFGGDGRAGARFHLHAAGA
jgi:hypothetical protein